MHSEIAKLQDGKLTGKLRYIQRVERLIIVCHGYQSSSDHPATMAVTEGLNKKGYATFVFNFSDEDGFNLKQQVADIDHVVNHFGDYPEIVLMASSFGALSTAIAAAKSPRVTGLVTINGFFGSGKLGRKIRSTYLAFRLSAIVSPRNRRSWSFFKREFQPSQISVPVLVVHAEGDEVVSVMQSKDFFDKLTAPKQFMLLEEVDHHLTSAKAKDMVLTVLDLWLQGIKKS